MSQATATMHTLPNPLTRLHGIATAAGITIEDLPAELEHALGAAAMVAFGEYIALSSRLLDEQRAGVLAMAIATARVMVPSEHDAHPGDIVSRHGFVIITTDPNPFPADPVGQIATALLRGCGRETGSAAFAYYVPVLPDHARTGSWMTGLADRLGTTCSCATSPSPAARHQPGRTSNS